jgi:hypothetical protein
MNKIILIIRFILSKTLLVPYPCYPGNPWFSLFYLCPFVVNPISYTRALPARAEDRRPRIARIKRIQKMMKHPPSLGYSETLRERTAWQANDEKERGPRITRMDAKGVQKTRKSFALIRIIRGQVCFPFPIRAIRVIRGSPAFISCTRALPAKPAAATSPLLLPRSD